jgi:hypothetical protein
VAMDDVGNFAAGGDDGVHFYEGDARAQEEADGARQGASGRRFVGEGWHGLFCKFIF